MGWKENTQTGLKILLILIGLADLVGLLPNTLDLGDKLLTSFVLLYFWYLLSPSKFLFGVKSRTADYFILFGFYVLSLNAFLRFFLTIDPQIVEQYSEAVNYYSFLIGMIMLFLLSIYFTFFVYYKKKSVIASIFYAFSNNDKKWEEIADKKIDPWIIFKFLITFFTLFIISQYFFGLITQWFVVSLDKSLFFVAIFFSIKDLEKSKVKALHALGEIDDLILETITNLFTNPRKVGLGFGLLLVFHYLSDIGTFFIFYIFNLPLETAYYALAAETHRSLWQHFATETIATNFDKIATLVVYGVSAFGSLAVIVFPIILSFFIIFKINLKKLSKNNFYAFIIALLFFGMLFFYITPWTKSVPILDVESGIVGVDFPTAKISSVTPFTFSALFYFSIFGVVLAFLAFNDKLSRYINNMAYLFSTIFLGIYCWTYFISTKNYNIELMQYFYSQSNNFFAFNFAILTLLGFLFYVCVFLYFVFITSRYIITNITKPILNNTAIILWTFVLLILPTYLLYNLTAFGLMATTIVVAVLFVFSIAMFVELRGREYRDDYLLGVTLTITAYQVLLLFSLFFSYYIREGILNFFQPVIIFAFTATAMYFFGFRYYFKLKEKPVIYAILLGIIFGVIFYLIKEPKPILFDTSLMTLIIYTLFIAFAEESLFRLIVLRLAERALSFKSAVVMQAIVFSGVHLVGLKSLLEHYGTNVIFFDNVVSLIIYAVLLFIFAVIAALFVKKKEEKGNILYAIIFHWITNLVSIAIGVFWI
ncbi:MAG: CPBP family glutamic-type intramembrane protease [Candidatus Woesearchaeota archaeon]